MTKLLYSAVLLSVASTAFAQFSPVRYIEASELGRTDMTVAHDLDGDGDRDVAMSSSMGVAWWPNDGQGGNADLVWIHPYSNEGIQSFLAAADMDADGDMDLVSAENYTGAYLHINDGSGGFAAADTVLAVIGDMRDIVLAELTGDGLPDLLISDYATSGVTIYPNIGGGLLGAGVDISAGIESVDDLLAFDADGDADIDVVFASYAQQTALICVNQGSGTFSAPTEVFAGPFYSETLQAADMDGDGDNDLVVANGDCVWYANDGNGVFDEFGTTIAGSAPVAAWDVALGDLDGDGDIDAVPTSYEPERTGWYANDGAGQFTAMGALNEAPGDLLALADLDGDLDLDLYQTRRNAVWWPNDGTGHMGRAHFICVSMEYLTDVEVADMDGDGDQDVLASSTMEDRVTLMRNDGTGQFPDGLMAMTDTIYFPQALQAGDIDADGDNDLIVMSGARVHVFTNDGTGELTFLSTPVNGGSTMRDMELGDVDGDGDPDLVTAEYSPSRIRYQLNDGSGAFAAPIQVSALHVRSFDLGDADGDGDLDLMTAYGTSNTHFIWFANNGSGTFTQQPDLGTVSSVGADCASLAADMDMDGTADLLFATPDGITLYHGSGGGIFSAGVVVDELYSSDADLFATDIDSDGDPDIAWTCWSGMAARYLLNDGTGAFGAPGDFDQTVYGQFSSILVIADMDGDGDPDPVLGNRNGDFAYSVGWVKNYFNSAYRIDGTLFHDVNENGAQDAGEGPLPFVGVHADPVTSVPLSAPDGSYSIFSDAGDYEVTAVLPNAWWGITTAPSSYDVQLTTGTPVSMGNDFGYAPVVDTTVVELGIAGNIGVCGDTTMVFLTVMNLGTSQPSGTFCGMVDTLFTIVSLNPPPVSVTGNIYCWDIDSLYFYTPFTIAAEVLVPDASYMGTLLVGGVQMTETDGQGNVLQTFQEAWAAPLTCSYDPNYKEVSPAGYGDAGAVDIGTERLEYTIHFQNTGTAPAQDVVLVDRLADELDPSSLQVLGYSHSPTAVDLETDRDVVIRFDGIQLPDSGTTFTGSQGFIRFAVNVVPGLAHATTIENTANIFFDLNEPVITNTTLTTLVDCDLAEAVITLSGFDALQASEGDAYQWFLNDEAIIGATGQLLFPDVNGTYTCAVTTVYGCEVVTDPYPITSVSVVERQGLRLALMPNPMNTSARLVFSETLRPRDRIQLMDMRGAEVRDLSGNAASSIVIDRDGLADGLYVLRVMRSGSVIAVLRMAVAD